MIQRLSISINKRFVRGTFFDENYFGNYSVLLYLYFTEIIFLTRLLCVTYRFRTTLTKNKQQFETHGFGCVSQQNTNEKKLFRKEVIK